MKLLDYLAKKLRNISSEHGFTCDQCGAEVFDYPRQRLCGECLSILHYNGERRCEKCGRQTVAEGTCLDCKSRAPAFDKGISPFSYRGKTASLINRIKNGDRRLSYFFAEEMSKAFLQNCPLEAGKEILVVPVPITKEGVTARGYNQAEDLGERIVKALNEAEFTAVMDKDILLKTRETKPQKQLHLFERAQNVHGAFRVHKRTACRDKTILLVDDIMTTGATGSECARVLKNAGAKTVYFLAGASLPELK